MKKRPKKRCPKCDRLLDLEKCFYKNKKGYWTSFCRSCIALNTAQRRKNSKKAFNVYMKDKNQIARKAVLRLLGDKCKRCGFSDKRALQVDHVHGGGTKWRRKHGSAIDMLKEVLEHPKEFQLLCANCNWIKRVVNDESAYRKHTGPYSK